ncbi:MAG: SMC family ATPase [Glutamicibacter sp.]|uniref:SMC family ATPase n=1 Tax=Glutamicibacter sp. TaxID=1931995 RepID=UPI002FCC8CFE
MRIHKLQIQAFGPFAGTEEIDFDELAEGGLFLLDGPTGAGKSSILDAICYALYGALPGSRAGSRQIRSDHAPAGLAPEVVCELTIGDRRFEVTRSPAWMRPSKRGKNKTTEQKAASFLREFTGSGWKELSTRNDEVGHVLGSLLGLDREQFTKVVMLPQGGFADFLRAKAKDREDLLANLFDTSGYARIEDEFAARLAEERKKTESLEARLSASEEAIHSAARAFLAGREASDEPAEADGEANADADGAGQAAAVDLSSAEQFAGYHRRIAAVHRDSALEAAKLRTEMTRTREQAQALEERRRIFARLAELRGMQAGYAQNHEAAAAAAARLDSDAKAGAVRAYQAQLQEASVAQEQAKATWLDSKLWLETEQGLDPSADAAGLEQLRLPAQQAAEELAVAKAGLDDEKRRGVLAGQARKAAELAAAQEETRAQAEAEVALLKAERAALEAADLDQVAAGGKVQQAKEHVKGLETRIQHATERDALEKQALAAREQSSAQELEIVGVANTLLDLRTEQLAQSALRLAAALEDGQPCLVCGAQEHPAPARADADAPLIDDEQIQALEAAVAAARAAGQRAAQARDTLVAKFQAAQEAAGDAPVADLRAELATAQAGLEREQKQQGEIAARVAKLDAVRQRTEQQNARASQAVLEHATAKQRAQSLQTQLAELDAKLEQLRQGRENLAELVAQLSATSQGLASAVQNLRRFLEAGEALEKAEATWNSQRTAAGFENPAAFEAALLDSAERERLRQLQQWCQEAEASAIATLEASQDCRKAQELSAQGLEGPSEEGIAEAKLLSSLAEERFEAAREQEVLAQTQLARHEQAATDLERQRTEAGPVIEDYRRLRGLAEVIRGGGENLYKMTLSTYVLAARLEEVAIAATQRLGMMSGGRYSLHHDDSKQGNSKSGLGLQVLDSWTGKRRETQTLSGGETFMASLALALGLADVISHHSGAVDMQTLFVDEGFGSLDAETLEEVMQALENLRAGGRTIGLVSHVAEMKQRITNRISVSKTQHGSTIERDGTVILAG